MNDNENSTDEIIQLWHNLKSGISIQTHTLKHPWTHHEHMIKIFINTEITNVFEDT